MDHVLMYRMTVSRINSNCKQNASLDTQVNIEEIKKGLATKL